MSDSSRLVVRQKRVGPIFARHPWVFTGALRAVPEGLETGTAVRLETESGQFLAHGYFNGYSQIAVRIWSWDEKEVVDEQFFNRRIERALLLRERILAGSGTNAYRLIFSENDLLPGLVVDRYDSVLCLQCHTRGIETWKSSILRAMVDVLRPSGVFERSDVKVRAVEGAEAQTGILYGEIPDKVEILENNTRFLVDVVGGQKTGFFLDQREKRAAIQRYVRGQRVLNCFSYTGGFSIYAGKAGATHVTSVDASKAALELAAKHVDLNELDSAKFDFVVEDVKAFFGRLPMSPENNYSVIILDPPAFVKDRRKVKQGMVGYRRINEAALRILPPGGILITCSCSGHVSMADFRHMLGECGARTRRTVQILESFGHGPDHPELAAFTEADYLKVLICAIW